VSDLTRPTTLDEATWNDCLRVDSATVSDVLNARGIANKALAPGLAAVRPCDRTVGLARTMRSRPRETAPEPGREYGLLFEAIDGLRPGEILVTDSMDCCVWGELCCERAKVRGANGTVIDGYHRDTARVRASGFPVFSRGPHPSDMLYHREIVALDAPVHCAGVYVSPGDLIVADEDGLVVVPATLIAEVCTEAVRKADVETKVRTALRDGSSATEAYRRYGVF
jgi:4-hydroxy-4-methyl-2-oxoglutarate aldolase